MEEILTERQKKTIQNKLKLNFEKELKKSKIEESRKIFSKSIRNQLDIFIPEMYNNGVLFYGFTIAMPYLTKDNSEMWYYIQLQLEGWLSTFRTEIELIEFCYISIELVKDFKEAIKFALDTGAPYFKGVIGVRTLTGIQDTNEIRKIFTIWKGIFFSVKKLNNITSIKKYWNYVIKENNFKFHKFQYFSKFYHSAYGLISDLELTYDNGNLPFDLCYNLDSKNNEIRGISEKNPKRITVISYLVMLYLINNQLFISDNVIYKKNKDFKYSWEVSDSIESFFFLNLKIIKYLKNLYPQQLSSLKNSIFLTPCWEFFCLNIKKNNHYLPCIDFKYDLAEFNDGIYFIAYNHFYEFNKNIKDIKMASKKYFNTEYWLCKKKLPKNWLNMLSKFFEHKDKKTFCSFLGRCFHDSNFYLNQKQFLCIFGKNVRTSSDSITKVLVCLFGVENVGIISNLNFVDSEQLNKKKLIICSDFKFLSKVENQAKILNIRIFKNNIPMILFFDENTNHEVLNYFNSVNIPFKYNFLPERKNKESIVFNKILKEFPQIMIYCNNLCFENNSFELKILKKNEIKNLSHLYN